MTTCMNAMPWHAMTTRMNATDMTTRMNATEGSLPHADLIYDLLCAQRRRLFACSGAIFRG